MEAKLPHDDKIDVKGYIEFVKKSHKLEKKLKKLENEKT